MHFAGVLSNIKVMDSLDGTSSSALLAVLDTKGLS
jgi:hypothetical protein